MSTNQLQQPSSPEFDPVELFPARIKPRKFTARAISEVERLATGAAGMTDLVKGEVCIPLGNNAYCRTVRLHEALHAIYTTPPSAERIAAKRAYTLLEQALEDARLHLTCAKTEGVVRRDELSLALRDLRGMLSIRKHAHSSLIDKSLVALIALRSAAILGANWSSLGARTTKRVQRMMRRMCDIVAVAGGSTRHLTGYQTAMTTALEQIGAGQMDLAHATLKPYFPDREMYNAHKVFPALAKWDKRKREEGPTSDVSYHKIEGKITTVAASMLSDETLHLLKCGTMPVLHVNPIFTHHNMRTYFGADEKHCMSGVKISAKKLATIVGPTSPKLFVRKIKRNGGSVLIDASSSMHISPDVLLKLVESAPLATIAFYNAPHDACLEGNLWIFSHNGKRARDFSTIYHIDGCEGTMQDGSERISFDNLFGCGNVVDFQAMQWLLTQAQPRYILTDAGWTGPLCTQMAANELLLTAIARKQLVHITSLAEMEQVLAQGGA